MYCVKCGVKLQDGAESCPLCATPVWNPEKKVQTPAFPERYPEFKNENKSAAFVLSVILAIAEVVLFYVAFNVADGWHWGGIAMLGAALGYIIFVLPLWIKNMPAFIAIAADHVAVGGYLLYVCCACGGHWFLPFAFPVTGASFLLMTAMAVLLKYTKKGRFFLFGGSVILWGGFTMLLEFFEHITFGHPMFVWSIYSASALAAIGVFLLLAGMIKPLREFLSKLLFF